MDKGSREYQEYHPNTDFDIANFVNDRWEETETKECRDQLDKIKENNDFFWNRQWKKEDRDAVEGRRQPALTFNEVQPLIRLVSGIQRNTRYEYTVVPTGGEDEAIGTVLKHCIAYVDSINNFPFMESQVFQEGGISSMAAFEIYISYAEDIKGEIKIDRVNPQNLRIDPTSERYDLEDAFYMIRNEFLDRQKLEEIYGDKTKEIAEIVQRATDSGDWVKDVKKGIGHIRDHYQVKECQWRENKKVFFLVSEKFPDGFMEVTQEDGRQMRELDPSMELIDMIRPKMRVSTTCCDIVLEDAPLPYDHNDFTIIPFFPIFNAGEYASLMEVLKDWQKEQNKRESQYLNLLNLAVNPGYEYETGTLKNPKEVQKWGSTPGYNVEIEKDMSDRIRRIDRHNVSSELLKYLGHTQDYLTRLTNINTDLLGQQDKTMSGYAINLRREQGLLGIADCFDNFKYSNLLLSKKKLSLIQQFLTDEKAFMVMGSDGWEQVTINQEGVSGKLNDVTVGKFDVVFEERPQTNAARIANFMTVMEAIEKGVPIPPWLVAELSDWPKKDEIIQYMQQLQGMQSPEGNEPPERGQSVSPVP